MSYEKEIEVVYSKLRKVLSLKKDEKYQEAIVQLTNLLPAVEDHDLKVEILSLRAMIYEEMANSESAKKDILSALSLIAEDNYSKYTLEMGMGVISEKENDNEDAGSWYSRALSTCIKIGDTSGGSAVLKLINLKGENNLSKEERYLCEEAVRISWNVLKLPGAPDLTNLKKASNYLVRAAGDRTRYPSS